MARKTLGILRGLAGGHKRRKPFAFAPARRYASMSFSRFTDSEFAVFLRSFFIFGIVFFLRAVLTYLLRVTSSKYFAQYPAQYPGARRRTQKVPLRDRNHLEHLRQQTHV
ncbi:hypothetical protein [Citrobacter sp.]|uniref:hypothetical protein n=1 Tax=Citrobacter sp. TaxID=1896336 RepID=UPI002900F430|nr:hypothetical protein [Citrobacter sp.]MDU2844578.1 hypothetical protein [Citrobacter sp.]